MTETWDSLAQTLESLKPAPYLGLVMVAAVSAQWLGWKLKVPSILLLLGSGSGWGGWPTRRSCWARTSCSAE